MFSILRDPKIGAQWAHMGTSDLEALMLFASAYGAQISDEKNEVYDRCNCRYTGSGTAAWFREATKKAQEGEDWTSVLNFALILIYTKSPSKEAFKAVRKG